MRRTFFAGLFLLTACAGTIPDSEDFLRSLGEQGSTGRALYKSTGCARCHGADGRGKTHYAFFHGLTMPNLRDPETYRHGSSREAIAATIEAGVAGTAMAPYPQLAARDRTAIAEYLLAWQKQAAQQ